MFLKLTNFPQLIFLFGFFNQIYAQDIPLGTWRTHLAYLPAKNIAISPKAIYCATANGLFYLDRETNSLETLTKSDRLSESIISQIAFDNASQTLLIVYENSNIDLIKEDEITEISLIKNAQITGSKQINHIYFYQNFAYLSSDFGVVVLDLIKKEIKETYQNLGTNGVKVSIRASAVSNDSLLLASLQGVMIASLNSNLQDFNNWQTFTPTKGIPAQSIKSVVNRGNVVYAAIDNVGLYKYEHTGNWASVLLPSLAVFNNLNTGNNEILINLSGRIYLLDANDNLTTLNNPLIVNPQEALYDQNGKLWIADLQNGLLTNQSGVFENIFPNGPARSELWALYHTRGQILALSGGFNPITYQALNNNAGFYVFENGLWTSYNSYDARNSQSIPVISDLLKAVYNPLDKNLYFASYGKGILVQKANKSYEIINHTSSGSPLRADINGNVRITGLAVNREGDLWVSNHSLQSGQPSLHVKRAGGMWQSFNAINSATQNPLDIVIDNNNFKWIRLSPNRGGGIWVLDDKNNRSRYLSGIPNSGNLPNSNVNTLVLDLEGQIWVGTDEGLTVFFNPSAVFEGNVNAITPIFQSRPLLRFEKVTAIAVDGANRKWIGTDTGLWLFSADGTQQIANFTEQNSPLLSNVILDIAINPQSGEVFIATDKGLVSYRATATQGSETHQNVKIFPNPVRPDFEGLVGISGLVENALVKITDVSGRLIYETKAEGATASWNLRDYNGTRAATGIYLIFSTNMDGTESFVGKMAVVK